MKTRRQQRCLNLKLLGQDGDHSGSVCSRHLRRRAKRQRASVTSHLSNHRHEVCGCGLVVQSLARFDSQDAAVPIDGKLGKRRGLIMNDIMNTQLTR